METMGFLMECTQSLPDAEAIAAQPDADYGGFFDNPSDAPTESDSQTPPSAQRVELIDAQALEHELDRLRDLCQRGEWMERATAQQRKRHVGAV